MTRKPKRRAPSLNSAPDRDSPAAEAVTACWMLALVTTFATEAAAIVANLVVFGLGGHPRIELFAGLLMFGAVIVAVALLTLNVLVLKLRRAPPPRPLVVAGWLLGATPLVLLLIRWAGLG